MALPKNATNLPNEVNNNALINNTQQNNNLLNTRVGP